MRRFQQPLSGNYYLKRAIIAGVRHERALFTSLFGTHDQREGMAAFTEKRKPAFRLG
jgi:enoyl-CoA hydratase